MSVKQQSNLERKGILSRILLYNYSESAIFKSKQDFGQLVAVPHKLKVDLEQDMQARLSYP